MIFVQLSLSYSHYLLILSLPFFLSLLFLTNEKREQQGCPKSCTKKVVQISLFLYLYIHDFNTQSTIFSNSIFLY